MCALLLSRGGTLWQQIFVITGSKGADIRAHVEQLQWPVVDCKEGSPRRGRSRASSFVEEPRGVSVARGRRGSECRSPVVHSERSDYVIVGVVFVA